MSDDLTNNPDIPWSYPSPASDGTTDGFVFMGDNRVTIEDFQKLEVYLERDDFDRDSVDGLSLCGLLHRDWNSNFYSKASGGNKPGGLGSEKYETQYVGDGVKFNKEPIWFNTAAGELVKEIPEQGYHTTYSDSGDADSYEGPEPGSEADSLLGDGLYKWDEQNGFYIIEV